MVGYSTAILPHPTPILHCILLPSYHILATSSYTGFSCHPTISYPAVPILSHLTTSYLVLNWILLPCYPVLSHRMGEDKVGCGIQSYHILPRPTLDSYSVAHCHPTSHPTLSYIILPHPTSSNPILHWILLPSYHILATASYTGFSCHPTISYPAVPILSHLTTSYLVLNWIFLPCYPVLPHPIP